MDEKPPSRRKGHKKTKTKSKKVIYKKTNGKNSKLRQKKQRRWVASVTLISFFCSIILMYVSQVSLNDLPVSIAFIVLICIVSIGVLFDLLGVAVTSADISVFHSMAAKKLKGSKQGIFLVKNADRVANFCNDVVGDICGVISGAAGALIVMKIAASQSGNLFTIVNILISSAVAALTVGGKALGKVIAIKNSNKIVSHMANFLSLFYKI